MDLRSFLWEFSFVRLNAPKARAKMGGQASTDVGKLAHAKILYENSEKTANDLCQIIEIGQLTV
jgi:hypothetical protein